MKDVQPVPINWLWPGRIARGRVTLIAGHPGLGKSQVTLSVSAIASTGGQWPVDSTRCERGSVIILSAEDDAADTIRPRLEAAGADLSRIHVVDAVHDGFNRAGEPLHRAFNLSADVRRLEELLERLCDVVLIIIDPASAYLGKVDSHSNAEVRGLLAPLAEMAGRFGVAVVAVSHLSKANGTEALLRVQGSVAFAAAARAVWGVARDKDAPGRRLLLPLKNNLGKDETGLAFTIEPCALPSGIETSRIVWEDSPVTVAAEEAFAPDLDREGRSELEDARDFLLGLLADGHVPSKQIKADSDGAGYAWSTIRRAQQALGVEAFREGGLGKTGTWYWRLPAKALENSLDAHVLGVSTLGKDEHLREVEVAKEVNV
jgi:hypothetical protein